MPNEDARMGPPGSGTGRIGQKPTGDFESQLARVVEQDGIVMATPSGLRRHPRRMTVRRPAEKIDRSVNRTPVGMDADRISRMDHEAIACLVRRPEAPEAVTIAVARKPHERSPFVVSLRECRVQRAERRDRLSAEEHAAFHERHFPATERMFAAGELSDRILRTHVDPWMVADQFMPAKTSGGGWRMRQWLFRLRHGLRVACASVGRAEQRMEREAEANIASALEETRGRGFSFARAAAGFLALAFIATLPAQALVVYRSVSGQKLKIQAQGEEAVGLLRAASEGDGIAASADRLREASDKFRHADELLESSKAVAMAAAAVMPDGYRSAKALLEAGDKMGTAGHLLAVGFGNVFSDPSRSLMERIEALGAYARGAQTLLSDAERAATDVDAASVPASARDQVATLPQRLGDAKAAVRELAVLSDALTAFLGKDGLRNYLVVFQNNTELRPTGGFMGSLAEVRLDRGRLLAVNIPGGGPYDLKNQLTERVRSPEPMSLINPQWQLQDANWFADFPTSAEKIRWFWSKSGQPTLDGVLAVNATFMQDVLRVLGPVDLPAYGKTIGPDNFMLELQKAVELDYDRTKNDPKKIIADLFDALLTRAKTADRDTLLALGAAAGHALDVKDIQVAMFDPTEEALVERFGWNGRIKDTPGDALAVIGTNIAGQKTDGVVTEDVTHTADIAEDGQITDTLEIDRTHAGKKGELFRGVRNVQYLRVYVPKGSTLIAARGFDPPSPDLFKKPLDTDGTDPDVATIAATAHATGSVMVADEGNRTVFGGWIQLDPGKSQKIVLTYRLPFTAQDVLRSVDDRPATDGQGVERGAYLMLLTSQSGTSRTIRHEARIKSPWKSLWVRNRVQTAEDQGKAADVLESWQGIWDRDQAVASLLTK